MRGAIGCLNTEPSLARRSERIGETRVAFVRSLRSLTHSIRLGFDMRGAVSCLNTEPSLARRSGSVCETRVTFVRSFAALTHSLPMGFDMRGAGSLVRWFVGWFVRSLASLASLASLTSYPDSHGGLWRVGQEWARVGSSYTIHTFSLFFTHISLSIAC